MLNGFLVSGPVADMTGSVMLRPPPLSAGSAPPGPVSSGGAVPDQPAERPSTLAVGEETAPPPPPRPKADSTAGVIVTDEESGTSIYILNLQK